MARKSRADSQGIPDVGIPGAKELADGQAGKIPSDAGPEAVDQQEGTWYRVSAKNPVTKKIGSIQFTEGAALVPSSAQWMLTWFREHGYRIEKA